MAPFKNDCGPKNPNQTVQDSKKNLLKMTVAKKTGPSRARYNMAPFKNDCGQKIRIKQCKIPKNTFENDSGQKNPIVAVQDTKWHLLKMILSKKTEPNSVRYKMAPFSK